MVMKAAPMHAAATTVVRATDVRVGSSFGSHPAKAPDTLLSMPIMVSPLCSLRYS